MIYSKSNSVHFIVCVVLEPYSGPNWLSLYTARIHNVRKRMQEEVREAAAAKLEAAIANIESATAESESATDKNEAEFLNGADSIKLYAQVK